MGGLIRAPKPPAPPPLPEPAPMPAAAAPPPPDTPAQAQVRSRRGLAGTIATSARGALDLAVPLSRKTLLGE
jgi:hypothetical protein